MTVIAWDGQTLHKIYQVGDVVYALYGDLDCATALMCWHKDGADPDDFPESPPHSIGDGGLVAVTHDGIYQYGASPTTSPMQISMFAWGTGGEFARGAMAAGKTSAEAVKLCIDHCSGCGMGVDSVQIKKPAIEP